MIDKYRVRWIVMYTVEQRNARVEPSISMGGTECIVLSGKFPSNPSL